MDRHATEGDALSELADAQQMSFIQGRWVYTDSDAEEQYQIVEPTLPGNGDYSGYRLLCKHSFCIRTLSSNVNCKYAECNFCGKMIIIIYMCSAGSI